MTTTTASSPADEQEIKRIREWAEEYARRHGYQLNPNEKQLNVILRGLARLKGRTGEQYCPCRVRSGDKEKDKIIICPCIYHGDEIAAEGHCHCNLFHAGGTSSAPKSGTGNTDTT
ncbi:MAG: ferredoxin:thioredoxin reductase [Methanomicrobiales archaeon]|nr:ferredoxin:thioredoxin reductase [Methanomicrobiales archaeon]